MTLQTIINLTRPGWPYAIAVTLGLGVAIGLSAFWPDLEAAGPVLGGSLVVVTCVLLHEMGNRRESERRLDDKISVLHKAFDGLRDELKWSHTELDALRTAAGQPASKYGSAVLDRRDRVDEVVAEVKVLQSLIERLYKSRQPVPPPSVLMAEGGPRLVSQTSNRPEEFEEDDWPTEQEIQDHLEAEANSELAASPTEDLNTARVAGEDPHQLCPVPHQLSEEQILEIAREALRDDRIDLVLQPIVKLPQRRRRYYECFTRLRTPEGYSVAPEQYIALAEREGLVTAIDNMLLFRCIQLVRKIQRQRDRVDFFCNVSRRSWDDEDFFNEFVEFLQANPELSGHLIFEVPHADFLDWREKESRRLKRLEELGCRFSIDQLNHLDDEPAGLAASGIRFAKVSPRLFLEASAARPGLIRDWRSDGVNLIIEKIEDEATLSEVLDYEIDLAQGFLFSEPRLARPAA